MFHVEQRQKAEDGRNNVSCKYTKQDIRGSLLDARYSWVVICPAPISRELSSIGAGSPLRCEVGRLGPRQRPLPKACWGRHAGICASLRGGFVWV